MKKSKAVPATLVAALAGVAAGGCNSGGYDECVDPMGNVVSDESCRSHRGGSVWVHRESGGFGGSGGYYGG